MEILRGANNWKLICRRDRDGVTILKASTCDCRAALPETIWDLPVRALGDHALAPGAFEALDGTEILVTCGPVTGGEEWDTLKLQELWLPDSLERVGDYAFFNCRQLKRLHLRDTVRYWGGGALMNCRVLDTFDLACTGQEGELLAYFAGELPAELDVTLTEPDGETVRLIFPEYQEIYEENCPAHHFDYNISGAGYAYHHCFYQKKLNLKTYDELWRPMLGMEHDPDCALRLAFYRLRMPRDLEAGAEADYLSYLRSHTAEAAEWLLRERDTAGLQFLLQRTEPDRPTLAAACELARTAGASEALALLLEEQHRRYPTGAEKRFDL
ncbi:Leucine rich repeat-containing protein [Oscillibacter sp. PC13]|uniref:leucine-rich repeat protein n=1 Tax=Oscillibacter sp. PC13 TaxID=1855299 RepID=UPI0008F416B3|nr:leucine-rich repeat protein [Oscillibacter sp. PC13]SFP92555.1 Leucine rich repeat-containing protein [Oscillibacter sp. PC13]